MGFVSVGARSTALERGLSAAAAECAASAEGSPYVLVADTTRRLTDTPTSRHDTPLSTHYAYLLNNEKDESLRISVLSLVEAGAIYRAICHDPTI